VDGASTWLSLMRSSPSKTGVFWLCACWPWPQHQRAPTPVLRRGFNVSLGFSVDPTTFSKLWFNPLAQKLIWFWFLNVLVRLGVWFWTACFSGMLIVCRYSFAWAHRSYAPDHPRITMNSLLLILQCNLVFKLLKVFYFSIDSILVALHSFEVLIVGKWFEVGVCQCSIIYNFYFSGRSLTWNIVRPWRFCICWLRISWPL